MRETTPLYLQGLFAPVDDEIDAYDLPVIGELPRELNGRYMRNGPNPEPGQDTGSWVTGPGMVHSIRLRGGKAEWYHNRWVRTTLFNDDAPYIRNDYSIDYAAVPANTHIVPCHGKVFALFESGMPYEMTVDLETIGPFNFGGMLKTGMTAHPKHDAVTGELHFYHYGFRRPYLIYYRLSTEGELVESREIEVPGPSMKHDFAVTSGHVIFLDLPVVFSAARADDGLPYGWDDDYGARIGIMPMREGAPVTWYDIDPCFIFHTANAHEDASGRIVLDAVRYSPSAFHSLWSQLQGGEPVNAAGLFGQGHLHRYVIDLAEGVSEEQLDGLDIEFPTFNEERVGDANRYLYAVSTDGIVKYDHREGTAEFYKVGHDRLPGEAVFVQARGRRGEDEGWLISLVTGGEGAPSELLVLDARDLSHVASVRLPRRVPVGLHGSWVPEEQDMNRA
ncbi:carotenoid cleavage dioxygenase [Sinosporangium album]|uniref:Dioxygenase n=1 Tax=Sinosporangium album TaxID=504805 RepID=A0A1G8IBE9_9ACTN|nr:carotenoid oxygenase family protein [Sinosporangium album]SDI16101.1 carotenoid cleavage dioxygenase [Sinosporangium album]